MGHVCCPSKECLTPIELNGHFTPEMGALAKCVMSGRLARSLARVTCLPSELFSSLEAGTVCSKPCVK